MRAKILLGILLCQVGIGSHNAGAQAVEYVYRGTWKTANRPLDGKMTCVVTPTAKHEWQGRFYGVWQGVDFDYIVNFTGPPKDLAGTAMIDGASYEWRAWITRDAMKANFTGSRYEGSFDLKRVPADGNGVLTQDFDGAIACVAGQFFCACCSISSSSLLGSAGLTK